MLLESAKLGQLEANSAKLKVKAKKLIKIKDRCYIVHEKLTRIKMLDKNCQTTSI